MNHCSDHRDMKRMEALLELVQKFGKEIGKSFGGAVEITPGKQFPDAESFIRATAKTGYHSCGACKMGAEDDWLAVVDPKLRVRGVKRLRVVDASIMPAITSGNTNAPTMMIASKAAELILRGMVAKPFEV